MANKIVNFNQNTNEEDSLSGMIGKLLDVPHDTKIGTFQEDIQEISNIAYGLEKYAEISVRDLVKDIYNLSQATFNEPMELTNFQSILYTDVENLAEKLGVELEEPVMHQNRLTIPSEESKQQNRLTMSKDERLIRILKNISEYAYTEDKHIKETLDARLMNDYLELADILGIDPEKYI